MADTTETVLTWNTSNWVTVILMASIGFFLLGLAQSWWMKKQGSGSGS